MGLIMKNGVAYGGVANTTSAAQVQYSNTSSGLTGTSVQSAIDEIALKPTEVFSDTEPLTQRVGDVWSQIYE